MNTYYSNVRLTDELERQLMLQAIEEQFRPHPVRALRNALKQVSEGIRSVAQRMAAARVGNSQTQSL